MKISILIITTGHHAKMLRETLRSIEAQSAFSFIGEVIISSYRDNAELDSLVDEYKSLPIIKKITKEKLTVAEHIESALHYCRYENVAPMSDDDAWGRNFLQECISGFNEYPRALAVAGQALQFERSARECLRASNLIRLTEARNLYFYRFSALTDAELWFYALPPTRLFFWGTLFKTAPLLEVIKAANVFTTANCADRLWFWRLGLCGQIVLAPDAIAYQRVWSGSTTAKTKKNSFYKSSECAELIFRLVREESLDKNFSPHDIIQTYLGLIRESECYDFANGAPGETIRSVYGEKILSRKEKNIVQKSKGWLRRNFFL